MAPTLVDIGINLTNSSFAHDLNEVIERAAAAGVRQQLITGTSLAESFAAAELAATRPQALYSTAGVHPHDAKTWCSEHRKDLLALLALPQVVAVGECGLDFNRDFSPRGRQETVFAELLSIAAETQLPLFLHERNAHERFLAVWKEQRDKINAGGVVHCFTGSKRALTDYLD